MSTDRTVLSCALLAAALDKPRQQIATINTLITFVFIFTLSRQALGTSQPMPAKRITTTIQPTKVESVVTLIGGVSAQKMNTLKLQFAKT
jgi:hypothetical protein